MGSRGMDLSKFQTGMDVEAVCRANGLDFVFIETNDGTVINDAFHAQADAAERAGAVVRPYFYLRPNVTETVATHLDVLRHSDPQATPRYRESIVDAETGSGGWDEVWSAHQQLWDAGQGTPLLYWPRFAWQAAGSPDLSPLAGHVTGHWKSWYPDAAQRGFDAGLAMVPDYVWQDNRGGIPVAVVQFTGTGTLDGYSGAVDLNYYPNSRPDLAALVGDDMATLSDADVATLVAGAKAVQFGHTGQNEAGETALAILAIQQQVAALAGALTEEQAAILAAVKGVTAGSVDVPVLAASLAAVLTPALATELGNRLLGKPTPNPTNPQEGA